MTVIQNVPLFFVKMIDLSKYTVNCRAVKVSCRGHYYLFFFNSDRFSGPWIPASHFKNSDGFSCSWISPSRFENSDRFGGPWTPFIPKDRPIGSFTQFMCEIPASFALWSVNFFRPSTFTPLKFPFRSMVVLFQSFGPSS